MCDAADWAIAPKPMCTGPTSSPTSIDPARNTDATANGIAARRGGGRRAAAAPPSRSVGTAATPAPVSAAVGRQPAQLRRDEADEADDARPPARGDVVAHPEHVVVPDCGDRAPAGSLGDGRCGLAAALRVRQHDQVGTRADDVLA